jgi:hypothetical protein
MPEVEMRPKAPVPNLWQLIYHHHQNPYGGARVALGTSVGAIEAIIDLEE